MKGLLAFLSRLWLRAVQAVEPLSTRFPALRGFLVRIVGQAVGLVRFLGAVVVTLASFLRGPLRFSVAVLLKNKFASAVVLVGLALITVLFVGLGEDEVPAVQADPLPEDRPDFFIGAVISLSGDLESQGNRMRRGYETAIAAYNGSGGIRVGGVPHNLSLLVYDDESSMVRAAEVTELMLLEGPLQVLLGPYSSALSQPVVEKARQNGIPVLLPIASAAGLSGAGGAHLLQTPPERHLVEAARIFLEQVRTRNASLVAPEERFANGPEPTVVLSAAGDAHSREVIGGVRRALAGVPSEVIELDLGLPEEEFAAAAEMLGSVDAMFVSSYADGATRLMEKIANEGINIPFVALTHCEVAGIARREPIAAEGALCSLHWQSGVKNPGLAPLASNSFENAYYEAYGSRPSHHAAAAGAAIQVIAEALRRSELSGTPLADEIRGTDLETFYGPVRFGTGGVNEAKPMVLSQVIQSRFVPVAPQHLAARSPNPVRPTLASSQ